MDSQVSINGVVSWHLGYAVFGLQDSEAKHACEAVPSCVHAECEIPGDALAAARVEAISYHKMQ